VVSFVFAPFQIKRASFICDLTYWSLFLKMLLLPFFLPFILRLPLHTCKNLLYSLIFLHFPTLFTLPNLGISIQPIFQFTNLLFCCGH
jgi:hypothetical protein